MATKPNAKLREEGNVGLLAEPRRRRILDWIQEEGAARVRDLVIRGAPIRLQAVQNELIELV